MAEKKRQEIIEDILSIKDKGEGNKDEYREFLESLNDEELQNLYDEIVLEDM